MTAGTGDYEPRHKRPESRAQQKWERTRPGTDYWPLTSGERTSKHALTQIRMVCALCGTVAQRLTFPHGHGMLRCTTCASVRFLEVTGR